jgi:hypothetical protein
MALNAANTSQTDFAFVPETTFGTTPTDPAFQRVRITSESLAGNIETTTTNEIRPDATVTDLIQTGASAGGDIGFELSYGAEFDTLLEHALRGSFNTGTLQGGTEKKSLSLEKKFVLGDGSDYYLRYTGARVGSLSLSLSAGSIITGSVGFQTLDETSATSALSNATYTDANTNDVMAAPDAANITVGNVSGTVYMTDLSLNVTSNLRNQNAVGNLYSVGIGYGIREVTGSMTVYFDSNTKQMYDDFVAGSEASVSFEATDGTNTYTFNLPRIKYSSGSVQAGGNNQDLLVELSFQALLDSGAGTDIEITN